MPLRYLQPTPRFATVRLPVQCVGTIQVTTSRKLGAVYLEVQQKTMAVERSPMDGKRQAAPLPCGHPNLDPT